MAGAMDAFWQVYFTILAFLLGACVGSFLNVCIYRIPRDLSVIRPRSHCPACDRPIPWCENIPLLSYLLLRGRCRGCGGTISMRYFVVELLTACLFLLVWLKLQVNWGPPLGLTAISHPGLVPVYWLAVAGLLLGTFVDFEHMIIPDRVTWGGMAAGLILSLAAPAMHGEIAAWKGLAFSAIGAAAGFGLLWFVSAVGSFIFRKDAMGFGDVKLLGAIGAFFGWRAVLFTVMVSSLLGSIVGVALIASGRKQMQSRIPYGPYLSFAAIIWMLWGSGWWRAYVEWLGISP